MLSGVASTPPTDGAPASVMRLSSNLHIASRILKSLIPFQPVLRRTKRLILPYRYRHDISSDAFKDGLRQIALLKNAGANIYGNVLEIGTGWLPITPILFHIAGAANVTTVDVERLIDRHTTREAKSLIANRAVETASQLGISLEDVLTRLRSFVPTYIVPWAPSDIPANSFDIVVSRATFEHIPITTLEHYLTEFRRILRRDGLMCHLIDNSDHWSHRDARLSRLNMLRYEDGIWWRLMCRAEYQNRLRHSDYARMFERRGWRIIEAQGRVHDRAKEDLKALPLASTFVGRAADDLAALGSMFVLAHGAA